MDDTSKPMPRLEFSANVIRQISLWLLIATAAVCLAALNSLLNMQESTVLKYGVTLPLFIQMLEVTGYSIVAFIIASIGEGLSKSGNRFTWVAHLISALLILALAVGGALSVRDFIGGVCNSQIGAAAASEACAPSNPVRR